MTVHNGETYSWWVNSRPSDQPLLTVCNHHSCLDDPLLYGQATHSCTVMRPTRVQSGNQLMYGQATHSYAVWLGSLFFIIRVKLCSSGDSSTASGVETPGRRWARATVRLTGLIFFVPDILLSIFTLRFLPFSVLSLSYLILVFSMRKCSRKRVLRDFHVSYSHSEWYLLSTRDGIVFALIEIYLSKTIIIKYTMTFSLHQGEVAM